MNYINEPYFAPKVWERIAQRDLNVIDKKARFFTYAKSELLLVALCVAEVVELVARVIFSIAVVPLYFVRGNGESLLLYRWSIIYTALTLVMTGKALYHNLFSKYAFINSIGPASQLLGDAKLIEKVVEIFSNIKENKEKVKSILKDLSGIEDPGVPEQANATNP